MKAMYFCLAVVLELSFLAFSSTALPLSLVKDVNKPQGAQKAYRLKVAANLVNGTVNPKTRRCGVTDAEEFTVLGTVFEKKDLTYRLENYTPDLPQNVVDTTIKEAFQYWADVTPLTFTQITSAADIEIKFIGGDHGDGSPFDGPDGVLAHAFSPGPGIGGDAHFDEDEEWTTTSEGINLLNVATHEFGHSLGLGHTDVTGSVMLRFYAFVPKENFKLSPDDVAGIQSLYGAAVDTTQAPNQASTQAPSQTSTPTPSQTSTPTPSQTFTQTPNQTSTQAPSQTSTQAPSQTSTQTPRQTSTQATRQTSTQKPAACDPDLFADAVLSLRRNILFKNGFYRIGRLARVFPVTNTWPSMVSNIDAAISYRKRFRFKIIFFSGSQYWVYVGNVLRSGYPKPITDFGLPSSVTKIDAAMHSRSRRYGRVIVFFVGNQFWIHSRSKRNVSGPYLISNTFRNISKVDAAVRRWGHIYLISGPLVYKYQGTQFIKSFRKNGWMNCT